MSTPSSPDKASATLSQEAAKRKRMFLNKFLSKTYHMIDTCDDSIACWSSGGDSFTVINIDDFEKELLPKYFNHSKFSSFIRQLNFYGFQKLRSDPDLQVHTKAVRFSHEFFRKGHPELLHKITRTTASKSGEVPSDQVESMQQQIASLQQQLKMLEDRMDEKIEEATRAMNENYTARVKSLEAAYEALVVNLIRNQQQQQHQQQLSTSWLPPNAAAIAWPPTSLADYIRSANVP